MRGVFLALLVVATIFACTEAEKKSVKVDKRLLADLLGGLVGGGDGDLLGGLLGDVLGGDLLGGDLITTLTGVVRKAVGTVLALATKLWETLRDLLTGVDLDDVSAVLSAFDNIPCNKVCPACGVIPRADLAQACVSYCTTTCRWLF